MHVQYACAHTRTYVNKQQGAAHIHQEARQNDDLKELQPQITEIWGLHYPEIMSLDFQKTD